MASEGGLVKYAPGRFETYCTQPKFGRVTRSPAEPDRERGQRVYACYVSDVGPRTEVRWLVCVSSRDGETMHAGGMAGGV